MDFQSLKDRDQHDTEPETFEEIIDRLDLNGHFAYLGQWMPVPDPGDFEPCHLDGRVSDERLEELDGGEEPSEAELALWTKERIDYAFSEGEGGSYMVAVYCVDGSEGPTIWGALFHGDGGTIEDSRGPFASEEELLAELRSSGVFRIDGQ